MRRGFATAVLAALLSGCGALAPPAAPAPAAPQQSAAARPPQVVKVLTDYSLVSAHHAPFFVALAKGYYRNAGLDVQVQLGRSSGSAIEAVANGTADVGSADAPSLALAVSKGVSVKQIAIYLQKSPTAIIYNRGHHPIDSPQALCGKVIGAVPGAASTKMLPAFLAANHVDAACFTLQSLAANALEPLLINGKIDGYVGYGVNAVSALKEKGLDAGQLLFADYGTQVLGIGLVASEQQIAARPEALRAFVAATNHGWQDAEADPAAAERLVRARFPEETVVLPGIPQILRLMQPLLHTAASEGHPLGWMAPQDWQSTLDALHRYAGLADPKPAADYDTDALIPQG